MLNFIHPCLDGIEDPIKEDGIGLNIGIQMFTIQQSLKNKK